MLRTLFINSDSSLVKEYPFLNDIPYDVKDEALRDLLKNYKSNFAKGSGVAFNLKYKSKKYSTDSFNVLSKHWNHKRGAYSSAFKGLNSEKPLPVNLEHTCRIIHTKTNEYFICIPRTVKIKESVCEDKEISLDPGVRIFETGYDKDGLILNIGVGCGTYISKLHSYKNKLMSIRATSKNSRFRRKIGISIKRVLERIQNTVSDMHKKIAKFLCSRYNIIIIPKLNFHSFKNITKKNRCKMASLAHCKFVDRLIETSKLYSNCSVKVITEEYTSKTCSNCRCIKNDLGSSKEFNCTECLYEFDRDVNGSFNIYLKYLREK